jgi:hypothetical protein
MGYHKLKIIDEEPTMRIFKPIIKLSEGLMRPKSMKQKVIDSLRQYHGIIDPIQQIIPNVNHFQHDQHTR